MRSLPEVRPRGGGDAGEGRLAKRPRTSAPRPPRAGFPPPHDAAPHDVSLHDAEWATFDFPLRTVDEVVRLLCCKYIAPTHLLACCFSTGMREACAEEGHYALSVDHRESESPGMHYVGDVQDVAGLSCWRVAICWPPCTHQAASNTPTMLALKAQDGRAFWGVAFVLWCFSIRAACVLVEQPYTKWLDLILPCTQQLSPAQCGDDDGKAICLRGRNIGRIHVPYPHAVGEVRRRTLREFPDADTRDRWRSSWSRYPALCALIAASARPLDTELEPAVGVYSELVERWAIYCYAHHITVPPDYANPDGRPSNPDARAYQKQTGGGDGRRVDGVAPASRRPPAGVPADCAHPLNANGGSSTTTLGNRRADDLPRCGFASLSTQGLVLCFVAMLAQPLVYAHLDGLTVIGVELHAQHPLGMCAAVVRRWAATATAALTTTAFLVGGYSDGPRVAAAPLDFAPSAYDVVRTPEQRRRRLAAGICFAWCTLAALAGCQTADPAARVLVATEAFVRPVAALADAAVQGTRHTFRFGVTGTMSLLAAPVLEPGTSPPGWLALQRAKRDSDLLVEALLGAGGDVASDFALWAERVRPIELGEIPPALLESLPDFMDETLAGVPFAVSPPPRFTERLPLPPRQDGHGACVCPRSAFDLMLPETTRRVRRWLEHALADLVRMRDTPDAERDRPPVLVIGPMDLYPCARRVVFDFTFGTPASRGVCGVPLDYHQGIRSDLNLGYLKRRLASYPNQKLAGFLLDGIQLEADVELQSVFVPHLVSLPNGFASVGKELRRLRGKGWYRFLPSFAYWPCYLNAQGGTPRKFEPDRWRRTTEGGGPRKHSTDRSGLAAWSLNDAARAYHLPRHLASDGRPEMRAWLRLRGLPRSVEMLAADALGINPPKHPKERKPTLAMIMNDISILRHAAAVLGEPIYLLTDDASDYFNQLCISPSEFHKLGVVFLAADGDLATPRHCAGRECLVIISERRLGFGLFRSSGIAQEFSEALLWLFRQDMDAADAPHIAADQRPSFLRWRDQRRRVEQRHGGHQQRLWSAMMYTDDPVFAVVGAQRALRLLSVWRKLTTDVGLIMAIPEKRTLGVWSPWLGALLFASLGLVVIPKVKLMRATRAIGEAIARRLQFAEYRSLVGLLEHFLCVNCAPRRVMHGLYGPHRDASIDGPTDIVRLDFFAARQLTAWLQLIATSGGAPVTVALRRQSIPPPAGLVGVASSDAATDGARPGLGGFCHGFYWRIALTERTLRYLHITVLELLATGFSMILFAPYLTRFQRVVFLSDALATPYTLARHTERSEMLTLAHHLVMRHPAYATLEGIAEVAHLSGEHNPLADCVSRGFDQRFSQLCAQLRVKPILVEVTGEVLAMLEEVVCYAERRGVEVRRGRARSSEAHLPPEAFVGGAAGDAEPPSSSYGGEADEAIRFMQPSDPRGGAPGRSSAFLARLTPQPPRPTAGAATPMPAQGRATPAPPPWCRASGLTAGVPTTPAHTGFVARLKAAMPAPRPAQQQEMALAAPPLASPLRLRRPPLAEPPGRPPTRQRSESRLDLAAREHARLRSDARVAMPPPFLSSANIDRLAELAEAAVDLSEEGVNFGTAKMDDRAWKQWELFCEHVGAAPLITDQWAREYPSELANLLGLYLLWVYPKLRGKRSRRWAKPDSAFAYPLAIIRIYERWKVTLPRGKAIRAELLGLLDRYRSIYGPLSLTPRRRQPILYSMLLRIETIAPGTRISPRVVWQPDTHLIHMFLTTMFVLWRTGHRLGEVVHHPSGEIRYLTRACLVWIIAGVVVADPTAAQLRQLTDADSAQLFPCESKTDRFGEIHSPFPSVLPFADTRSNAARYLRDIELRRPCHGAARTSMPLISDEQGRPYTHSVMDTLLQAVLHAVFGSAVAAVHSWHSFRIGLACALHEAKCPDGLIQLICRWISPESLHQYRRLGTSQHAKWCDAAERAKVDTLQLGNVPIVNNDEGFAALQSNAVLSARARRVLDAAHDSDKATRAGTETPEPVRPLPPSDTSALTLANADGRRVLVPSSCWPDYPCDEHGGAGWEALVAAVDKRGVATVSFIRATTPRGLPYADQQLELSALRPL
jgi:hypothetical protein